MNKGLKAVITFGVFFMLAFFLVGYVKNNFGVTIDWVDDVTIWDKLRWYYVSTFYSNILPSFVGAIIFTGIYCMLNRSKK